MHAALGGPVGLRGRRTGGPRTVDSPQRQEMEMDVFYQQKSTPRADTNTANGHDQKIWSGASSRRQIPPGWGPRAWVKHYMDTPLIPLARGDGEGPVLASSTGQSGVDSRHRTDTDTR